MIQQSAIEPTLKTLLLQMVEEGYVNVQKHSSADLYIYNYTNKTQFEWKWNEATLVSRGLILNGNDRIIARPFPKFFNLEEKQPQSLPNEPFEVYEKMDGSLGILYFVDNEPFIATRGSFNSEQSQEATKILYSKYASVFDKLKQDRTYLFEIIYPQNRIVVDYGKEKDIYLLAIIDNVTGQDYPLEDIGFPIVKSYKGLDKLTQLAELEEDNREGFVVKFRSGFRVKVKFQEYKRLHYIMANVSTKTIWTALKDGKNLEDILHLVPDEFYNWVRKTEQNFQEKYKNIETIAQKEYKVFNSRKKAAAYFQTCTYPSILFSMLDEKSYSEKIWRLLKPTFEKPFKNIVF